MNLTSFEFGTSTREAISAPAKELTCPVKGLSEPPIATTFVGMYLPELKNIHFKYQIS